MTLAKPVSSAELPPECLPKPGEVWAHVDGGDIYVLKVTRTRVQMQRRPFGDSLAEPCWHMLYTFMSLTTGRLKR